MWAEGHEAVKKKTAKLKAQNRIKDIVWKIVEAADIELPLLC